MNARQIARQFLPGIASETLALLNQAGLDETLPAGRRIKVVRPGR